jgi:DNA-binding CsgD family transcriptional regulator
LQSRDSLDSHTNSLISSRALLKVNIERHTNERLLLEHQIQLQKVTRNGLLVGIGLIAIIALLLIQQQRTRYRLRQEQATAEMKIASHQLEAFTNAVHEKNLLIDRFREELTKTTLTKGSSVEDPEALNELRAQTILTEEEWERFQDLFEKVHTGFFQRLQEKLPGLTPADTRYAALTRLNMSNKEIGAMLGIGASSVRTTRSRLRKKLNLGEDDSLETVINAI